MNDMLLFTEILIAILLMFFILIQNKDVSLNLSNMSGGMGEITKRGPEKILHNITIVLGTLFIINSTALFLIG